MASSSSASIAVGSQNYSISNKYNLDDSTRVNMPQNFSNQATTQEERITRAKRKRFFQRLVFIVLGIAVVGAFLWWLIRAAQKNEGGEDLGTLYPSIGQQHIGLADEPPTPYTSNPPTSGGHFAQSANWGLYDYEVNDKIFLHNLEHGGIWIAYRPTISAGVFEDLKTIVEEFGRRKFVMAPRSANDADVAIMAWMRVLKFDLAGGELTEEQKDILKRFYRAYKDRGPESVPDGMPGVDPKSVQ